MSDDGLDAGGTADDSPWRPGAEARFDHPPIRPFGGGAAASVSDRPAGPGIPPRDVGPSRRGAFGLALVVVLALVGVALLVRGGDDAPAGGFEAAVESTSNSAPSVRAVAIGDLGGDVTVGPGDVPLPSSQQCPAQRLPSVVDPLWSVELPDARQVIAPVTVGDDAVVAVVGFDDGTANGLGSAALVGLNLDDGQERWRTTLQPATGRHEIVGVVDGAVIVRSSAGPDIAYRRLFAFDEGSGATLWDRGFRGSWSATVQPATGLVYVGVRRPAVSTTDESEVEVLDPRTGARLHIAGGAFVGLDPDGRLVTRIGDKVLATSIKARDLLGAVAPDDAAFAVVGTRVVVARPGATELDVYDGDGDARPFPLVGSTGIDPPGFVVALDPLGGSSLLVHGDGAVHGAQVGDDSVELRWRVTGVVVDSAATDRGRSLLVAADGGARQRVVDSSTGRTIVDLELRPGAFTTLSLVANGVIAQDDVDGDAVRVALDLDGREQWSLPGSGPVAVGSHVVVDVDDSDALVRVAAFGDPVGQRSDAEGCAA